MIFSIFDSTYILRIIHYYSYSYFFHVDIALRIQRETAHFDMPFEGTNSVYFNFLPLRTVDLIQDIWIIQVIASLFLVPIYKEKDYDSLNLDISFVTIMEFVALSLLPRITKSFSFSDVEDFCTFLLDLRRFSLCYISTFLSSHTMEFLDL